MTRRRDTESVAIHITMPFEYSFRVNKNLGVCSLIATITVSAVQELSSRHLHIHSRRIRPCNASTTPS